MPPLRCARRMWHHLTKLCAGYWWHTHTQTRAQTHTHRRVCHHLTRLCAGYWRTRLCSGMMLMWCRCNLAAGGPQSRSIRQGVLGKGHDVPGPQLRPEAQQYDLTHEVCAHCYQNHSAIRQEKLRRLGCRLDSTVTVVPVLGACVLRGCTMRGAITVRLGHAVACHQRGSTDGGSIRRGW